MAFLHREIRKTIAGEAAYASNRSFLEFINDSLRDLGISNSENLPYFKNKNEEATIKELMAMRSHLYELRELAYNVKAHESILDRAASNELDLPLEQLKFHQDFVSKNKPRVQEYYSATATPVEIIEDKIDFLKGLRSKLSPNPWAPDRSARPALSPLVEGVETYLETEKCRILTETVVHDRDISGFTDDFFRDLLEKFPAIPSWCRPEFRAQWARNIPPQDTSATTDFLNRPTQVISVSDTNVSENEADTSTETLSTSVPNNDPRSASSGGANPPSSESETDLFGEDSDSEVEILPSPTKKRRVYND